MIAFEDGILNRGDWTRIQQCMDRAAQGLPVTVGFLGGSITQGSLSSTPQTCYAYLVYQWWCQRFPNSQIRYINAGIGGTTSQFGVARVQEDLLQYQPDFVLMEFSVNDDNTPHFQETYEGLVRRILKSGTALILMHNVCYDSGHNAQGAHLPIAQHYNLPCVSVKPTVYAALQRVEFQNRDITPDDLHPNDAGHALLAQHLTYFLETIRNAPRTESRACDLPAPVTANRYEDSVRYQKHNSSAFMEGFTPDLTPMNHITECFRRGYTAWNEGDHITFQIDCSCIGVQYRKSVRQPTPIAKIIVDGAQELILDGNFTETWGDCLYLDTVYESSERKTHTVEVRIVESHDDDVVPFYLVSIIGS